MPPKKGRGGGGRGGGGTGGGRGGRGAAPPAREEPSPAQDDAVIQAHYAPNPQEVMVRGLKEGGAPPLEKIHRAYALENVSKGKPRSLDPSALQGLKTAGDVDELVEKILGSDPNGRVEGAAAGRVGLRNLGMTCYINTVLQCLAATDGFAEAVLGVRSSDRTTQQLQKIVAALRGDAGLAWVDPEDLIRELDVCASEQQDAHEFYRLFLEFLVNENEKATAFGKRVKQLCEYGVLHTTTCGNCHTKKLRHEAVNELNLYFGTRHGKTALSLEEALDAGERTLFTEENQYSCDKCGGLQDAEKLSSYGRLPEVAVVSWVRFVYNMKTMSKTKKQNEVNFPVDLDLHKWTTAAKDKDAPPVGGTKYRLLATVHHIGDSAYGGHYVARIRDRCTGAWYLYDDQRVTEDPKVRVDNGRITSSDAYLCIYERVDEEAVVDVDAPVVSDPFSASKTLQDYKRALEAEAAALRADGEVYAARKKSARDAGLAVVEWWNARRGFTRQPALDLDEQQRGHVFVPTWWLHAFGHGRFIDPQVQSVRISKTGGWGMESKAEPEYLVKTKEPPGSPAQQPPLAQGAGREASQASSVSVDLLKDGAGGGDAGDSESGTQPSAAGFVELYRDPFDKRNFEGLRCPHGRVCVDPEKARGVKMLTIDAAKQLRAAVGVKPQGAAASLTTVADRVCGECVRRILLGEDLELRTESRRKEMLLAAEHAPAADAPAYLISVKWWNEFKKKSRDKELLLQWDLFDGVRCPHGKLHPSTTLRRLVSEPVYKYLTEELSMHASQPTLSRADSKECDVCFAEQEASRANWMEVSHVKRELKGELKMLTDAVRKPGTSVNVLTKDWQKECRDSVRKWQKEIAAIKRDDEKKRQQAEKQLRKEQEAEVAKCRKELDSHVPMSPVTRIVCVMCNGVEVMAREWAAHKESAEHKDHGKKNHPLERTLMELNAELLARRKRHSPDGADTNGDDTASPRPKRACRKPGDEVHAAERAGSAKHADPAEEEEAMDVEDDDDKPEEPQVDPRFVEPKHFVDASYAMIPHEWGEALVEWMFDSGTDVPRPEPLCPNGLYCEGHCAVKYNVMDFRPPVTKKEREAVNGVEPPPLPLLLVPAKCLEALRQHAMVDESIHSVPTFRVYDTRAAEGEVHDVDMVTEPAMCVAGCPRVEFDAELTRLKYYASGTITVVAAKSAARRAKPKISPTAIDNVDSSKSISHLLLQVYEATGIDPRLQQLVYKDTCISEIGEATLETYDVPNNATLELTMLENPRTDMAGLGRDAETPAARNEVETGFTQSRLHGNRVRMSVPAGAQLSFTCPVCTFINEGQGGPPCGMCGS